MVIMIIISDYILDILDWVFPTKERTNAINLLIVVIVRKEVADDKDLIFHEKIHLVQLLELLVIGWLVISALMLVYNYAIARDWDIAYHMSPFEKEAYANQGKEDYLKTRPFCNWIRYI